MLVANWIFSYVLKDMLAIHQNGTSTTSRKRPSPRSENAATGRTSAPLAQQIAADQHDADHQERHDEDRDGHAAAPAELPERHLIGVHREYLGGRARPAPRHHVDDVEVVDGEDEGEERRDDDHVL